MVQIHGKLSRNEPFLSICATGDSQVPPPNTDDAIAPKHTKGSMIGRVNTYLVFK
ncbi:MAG: hypothetical protein OCC49_01455 [Fibrobacterales bacterium]